MRNCPTRPIRPKSSPSACSWLLAATFLAAGALRAQCGVESVPGFPHFGPSGPTDVVTYWDPDGAGPESLKLFVGGRMEFVESTPCPGAALYDPVTREWTALPFGMFDQTTAAVVDGAGQLVIAGSISTGTLIQFRVGRFDGANWTVMGANFDAPIRTLSMFGGDVIVGGEFTQSAAQSLNHVARWDGSAWQPIGGGVSGVGSSVNAFCSLPNGALAVGGTFDMAGGVAADNIARWDGTTWQAFGSGLPAPVTSIAAFSAGEVFATGLNQSEPAQWDGVAWNALLGLSPSTGSANQWVSGLAVGNDGNGEALYAAGHFSLAGFGGGVASWSPLFGWGYTVLTLGGMGGVAPAPISLSLVPAVWPGATQMFAVAGPFTFAGGGGASGVASVTNGYLVDTLGNGVDGALADASTLANGSLLIGGQFRQVNRNYVTALAVGDAAGNQWQSPSSAGLPAIGGVFAVPDVRTIVEMSDGRHLLGGSFSVGNPAPTAFGTDVAIFDGATHVLTHFGPTPLTSGANAVLAHSDGTIYAGGNGVYHHDGAWTNLTSFASGLGANCMTLAELPGGDVVVGGDLQVIPGPGRPGVMRWDGVSWQPLGTGLASVAPAGALIVRASVVRDDGLLIVAATAGSTDFLASFDGVNWQLLPGAINGTLLALELLPNGELVVGGEFDSIAGVAAASIARFDGVAWRAIGDGVRRLDGAPGLVRSLHFSAQGDLLITGDFESHDGNVSVNFTRVRSLCAASTQSFASGCVGSAGQVEVRSTEGAWLGGTMRSVASGLPSNSLAVDVLGLATAFAPLPLSSCTLWVRPDLTMVRVPSLGEASTELALPYSPALIGLVLYQQVVSAEITAGAITSFVGSNRLQHTVGVF